MTTPLVAQAGDSTTGLTGLGLVEDAHQIAEAIRGNSWVDGVLGGVGASLDGLALAIDPLGTLAAWGVAWLIEHVQPLQDALDWLAGDVDEIAAQAATWRNVAAFTDSAQQDYADRLRTEVAGWFGASGDAYRAHASEHLAALKGISTAAGGISSAVEGAGLLVSLVRGIVRDLIAQFVATLAVRLPQWLAAEGLTLGLATPVVASQVAALVARGVNKIQHFIRALLNSLRRLMPMIDRLGEVLERLRMLTDRLARSSPSTRPEPTPGPATHAGTENASGNKPEGDLEPNEPRPAEADARDSTPQAFVDEVVSNPRSVAGHSAQSIADQFNAAGYSAVVEQSTRSGTSGNAIQVRIHGHPDITNIQVHPGGGRHTPEGSPYWKISTNTVGKIWIIPENFRGADELRGNVVRYDK
uniref:Uncharacterized protein n=1 Tax=Actinoplanes garbadinensis TaxID=69485 RepID=C4NFG8_ACTGA|nr:hypothetical protein [Actinoplanes garbadinensis]